MGCASGLAVTMDSLMLLNRGVSIASSATPDSALPSKTGATVANELCGRLLLRYLLSTQIGSLHGGSTRLQFVTPTPLAPRDTVAVLALPAVSSPRNYVVLLDPMKIPVIQGPRWVKAGSGIEYLLPGAFPQAALIIPWEVQVV